MKDRLKSIGKRVLWCVGFPILAVLALAAYVVVGLVVTVLSIPWYIVTGDDLYEVLDGR